MSTLDELKKGWYETALKNRWIKRAWDPPFTIDSIMLVASVDELKRAFLKGNWCLGQGFALVNPYDLTQNICFVNQIDGGDEWLVIKDQIAFESFTWQHIIRRESFEMNIRALLLAPIDKCMSLDYMDYANDVSKK